MYSTHNQATTYVLLQRDQPGLHDSGGALKLVHPGLSHVFEAHMHLRGV